MTESLFDAARRVLSQEAIDDDPEMWGGDRQEAWEQLNRLESTLILLRTEWDDVDTRVLTPMQSWARHGQRTVLELVERAVRG